MYMQHSTCRNIIFDKTYFSKKEFREIPIFSSFGFHPMFNSVRTGYRLYLKAFRRGEDLCMTRRVVLGGARARRGDFGLRVEGGAKGGG